MTDYSRAELLEAKRQIESVLQKTKQVTVTFEAKDDPSRYRSQITLANRRVQAFEIASRLIDQELEALK